MKSKKKRCIIDDLMILLLTTGIGTLTYPFASDVLNNYLNQRIIAHHQAKASQENTEEMAELQEKTKKKSQELTKKGSSPGLDPFSETQKATEEPDRSYFESHTISISAIPKINVRLPIFDKTNALLLGKESSLLERTSYPIGGVNTHTVISDHRGLPQIKLFTDLPELKEDDEFYIEVSGKTLVYQVDQIKIVEPTNAEDLHIESGQDFVTLSTHTPYMTNSHRLLIREHRTLYQPEEAVAGMKKMAQQQNLLLWALPLIACTLITNGFIIWYKQQEKTARKPK